jgi:hypothetical protein
MLEDIKRRMETCTDWYIDNCEFLEDMNWLVNQVERLESINSKLELYAEKLIDFLPGLILKTEAIDELNRIVGK